MTFSLMQAGLLLVLAGCGASPSESADPAATSERPFAVARVATFNSPWAMAFLPGSTEAIVTEKPGRLWLVDPAAAASSRLPGRRRVVMSSQGGLLDVAAVAALRLRQAGLSDLCRAVGERRERAGAGARRSWCATAGSPARRDCTVLWHDPAGGEGGQFGAIIAFAPDGKSLFLSSGERQRFTPAQDPNQPLGKILHLTLDGKPAPGNPMAGRTGAAVVTITDPPEDTEAAKHARRAAVPLARTEPHSSRNLEQRSPQSLRPRVRRLRAACGKPKWVRAVATS